MSKEILKGMAAREAKKTIINADSFKDFANRVKEGRGKKISVGGKTNLIRENGIARFSIICSWQDTENIVLFSEVYEKGKQMLRSLGRIVSEKDDLSLFVTIEDRKNYLQGELPGVKIIGPADRMTDQEYKEKLLEARVKDIKPLGKQMFWIIQNNTGGVKLC